MKKQNFRADDEQMIKFPLDVALGMTYLHAWSPPLIHRDLKRCARCPFWSATEAPSRALPEARFARRG